MKMYNTIRAKFLPGAHAFKNKPARIPLFCLFVVCSLFVSSLQAQVVISGSTVDEVYDSFVSAVTKLNGTGATSQTGRDIVITIQPELGQTITPILYMQYKGWNSLTVEGNGNNITFTGGGWLDMNGIKNTTFRNLEFIDSGTGRTVYLYSNCENITFVSCTLENTESNTVALWVDHATGVTVDNCDFIIGGSRGIQLSGTTVVNTTIKNSRFTKNQKSYTSGDFQPIRVASARNTLIQNNEFYDLLRSEANTNVITVPNVDTKTIIIEGNSFYETKGVQFHETKSVQIPTGTSRYVYVGGGYGSGGLVTDLRIKNNYFGSTASKCQGDTLSLGTSPVDRNFICVETSTSDAISGGGTNSDSIIGNHFRKISMSTTSTQSPGSTEEKRGALTAYYNYFGGYPQIKQNVVDSLFLKGLSSTNVYLVGFGHTGSEPYFEGNTISNLITNNTENTGAGSISAICLGAINVPASASAQRYVTFNNNTITNLRANSKASASNSAQHVIGIRFNHYGGRFEGNSLYSGNKISNLYNQAESDQAHFVAGFYSEHNDATYLYRKVYENNEISNLNLARTNTSSGIYGIYFKRGKSSYIANNTIRNLNLGSTGLVSAGAVYGIYTPNSTSRNDTIANNRIYHLAGHLAKAMAEGVVVAIRNGGGTSSRVYNNFISNLSLDYEGSDYVTAILNKGGGNFYNNVVSICNSNNTLAILDNSSGTSAYYHNTIYINSSGADSYAFNASTGSTTATNNIFHNAGQGGGFYSAVAVTVNNNLYCAPNGTPYSNAGVTTIPPDSYGDTEPHYLRSGLCNATNITHFKLMESTAKSLPGVSGTGITVDIGNNTRNAATPTIGAWEGLFPTTKQRLFVKETATAGQNNGTNWENAFLQFSDALEVAGEEGDSIFIAEGTYYPQYLPQVSGTAVVERDKTFELKNKVKVFGGYPNKMIGTNTDFAYRDSANYESILSGDIGKAGDRADNAYHVLLARGVSDVILDGLTIAHAYSDDPSAGAIGKDNTSTSRCTGGGIHILNSDITLSKLIIKENLSCLGGGIYYTNNNPKGSLIMTNTIVSGNTAHGAETTGGGIYLNPGNAEVRFYNSLISGNLADGNSGKGGGVYVERQNIDGGVEFNNLTIARNYALEAGGVYNESNNPAISLNNAIVYGNNSGNTGTFSYQYSLIQGIPDYADPLFIDLPASGPTATTAGDYRLKPGSPAIYMGSMSFVNPLYNKALNKESRSIDGYVDMGAYQQTAGYWMGTNSTDWDDPTNWISEIPAEGKNVYYHPKALRDLHVNPATDRTQDSICRNHSDRGLYVPPGAYLKIGSVLDGFDETNFTIGANAESENGTFIYPQGTTVRAKVLLYSKAVTEEEHTNSKYFKWQYITCPVSSFPAKNMHGSWIRKYEEGSDRYWALLNNSSTLYPFAGYEISRKLSTNPGGISTFFGELVNRDESIPITHTEGTSNPYKGKLVLGNPYTAPLSIQNGFDFGPNMQQTVFLFHTGSSEQWTNGSGGEDEGQYLSVPCNNAGYADLPTSIASMQGFVLQINRGTATPCSVTFNYKATCSERPKMRSASSCSEKRYTVIKLLTDDNRQADIAWLFVDENTTRGFDNGYDGRKWFGEGSRPSLSSSEEDGNYQVNTIPDIEGTCLSVKAGEGQTDYKLTFNHSGTNDEGLYLHDLKTGSSTDISADGSVYEFTADNTQQAEKRFRIVRASTSLSGEQAGASRPFDLAYTGQGVALSSHIATQAHVSIFDPAGKKVGETNLEAGETKVISTGLTRGIYILEVTGDNRKQPMKFIVD